MVSNLLLSPPFDMAGVISGLIMGLISLVGVILLEAVVLWLVKWGSILKSLFAAFLINAVTFVLGFFVIEPCTSLVDDIFRNRVSRSVEEITFWIILWALTVIVEGVLLSWIDNSPSWVSASLQDRQIGFSNEFGFLAMYPKKVGESNTLSLRNPKELSLRNPWVASLIINVASYIGLFILWTL